MKKALVLGGTGFVGSSVTYALRAKGLQVSLHPAPRLSPIELSLIDSYVHSASREMTALTAAIADYDIVVNAAGIADATSRNARELNAANAALPALLARACHQASTPRLIHVSSAAVQGRLPVLDDTPRFDVRTPYGLSKAAGESKILHAGLMNAVVYRPAGVHGLGRRVTVNLAKYARSPFSAVSAPADSPTPQALIQNVADAIAFIANANPPLPPIIHHPWEGVTVTSLLHLLSGGLQPRVIPRSLASTSIASMYSLTGYLPWVNAHTRRIEILWLGQRQATSWLTRMGWTPPAGLDAWREIAASGRSGK